MDDDLEGIKCISRRRYNPYQDTDTFIDECPSFLKDIPEWHKDYFERTKLVYRREARRYLQDTLISLIQVNRVESVYCLCLILFPYPKLHAERDRFKMILGDAVRLNNFKLHSGNTNDHFLFTKKWFECLSEKILLDDLEQAARRGWLYDYGYYVTIWRRYVDEKEACFQQDFEEFESQQQFKRVEGSTELELLDDVSVKSEKIVLQESSAPNSVEVLIELKEKTCKPSTQEQIDQWCAKVESYYSPVGRYKFHINICRKIASEEGFNHSAAHIANETRGIYQKLKAENTK